MATGSGKTKVMSLAIVWQYLNAVREDEEAYARTFLIIAPNVIVYERLKADFEGGRIFTLDPLIPRELKIFWDFACVMLGDAERAPADGMLFLTNIQQLYDRTEHRNNHDDEPDIMTEVLGPKPKDDLNSDLSGFSEMLARRTGQLLVLNDEAHHTHEEESEWNKVIRRLHTSLPIAAQLDFSATPRFTKGGLFPWVISDYPIKQAIIDNVVKRPAKGIADFDEAKSDVASVRYQAYLNPLPRKPTDADIKKFQYQAFDIITMEKLFEREYAIKEAQRPDEIVSYYAKLIALSLKLPSQFSALAPKVWDFFEGRAFGGKVDMYSPTIIQAMNHRVAGYVVLDVFAKA